MDHRLRVLQNAMHRLGVSKITAHELCRKITCLHLVRCQTSRFWSASNCTTLRPSLPAAPVTTIIFPSK